MNFPTWKEYEAASEAEQKLFWMLEMRKWEANYQDQVAADVVFDRSETLAPWLDEYTNIGGDAARMRHAGKMTAAMIRSRNMNLPARQGGDILESVIMKGDLSRLTPIERVEYYDRVCQSVGLNPLTQPFAYITLNGKLTLYAKRDAADQLRKINNISIEILSRVVDDDLYTVHVRARDAMGRTDEDYGTVPFPGALRGEARANAILKAVTKAKRRVTLSICGLGLMDETEVEDIPGARPERMPPRLVSTEGPGGTPVYDLDTGEVHEPAVADALSAEDAASHDSAGPPSPDESAAATSDSKTMFMRELRQTIDAGEYKKLCSWWNSKAEVKKRNDFGLTPDELEAFKGLIMLKRPAQQG